ncbi:MAG: hypothetical protein K9N51_06235 [Candidatus Pacebacteria bacterium]|nr:hypothetical protein [Candidatus Paceibacterota bacterium]
MTHSQFITACKGTAFIGDTVCVKIDSETVFGGHLESTLVGGCRNGEMVRRQFRFPVNSTIACITTAYGDRYRVEAMHIGCGKIIGCLLDVMAHQ